MIERLRNDVMGAAWAIWAGFVDEEGQGTTEYAILVGVLVVIAILSIVTFKGKVQQLWDAIASGIGSL
jgi:Flp pilus assembly pilin Flp